MLPCGHICGSRCLESQLDTTAPKCAVCDRKFPLRPKNKVGVHGPADEVVEIPSRGRSAAFSQTMTDEKRAIPGSITPAGPMGSIPQQTTWRNGTRGMSILDILNSDDDDGVQDATSASSKPTPTTKSAMPRAKATMQDLMGQVQAMMEGGQAAEDIEAAEILLGMSAGGFREDYRFGP